MYGACAVIPLKTRQRCRIGLFLCVTLAFELHRSEVLAHGTSHELIESASRKIALRPEDASLYLRRAVLHLDHGDWLACLLDVDEAELRQVRDTGAGLVRARALSVGSRFEEAKAVLEKFLAAHPDHAPAMMEHARVLRALGRKEDAAKEFGRAMSRVPQPEPDQVFELAALLCAVGREAEALAAIDRAMKATPGVPSFVECAVKIEMDARNFDGALRRLDEAIRAVRIKEPLMGRRAAVLAQAGRFPESISAWRELQARLSALPDAERGSHSMASLLERTRHAIGALTSLHP